MSNPFPNFIGETCEVLEWISNFTLHMYLQWVGSFVSFAPKYENVACDVMPFPNLIQCSR